MEKKDKPLLIVVSIVRNEAWVLDAFLSAASLWADKVIIADQMSTDGSRDIYKRYPKVHVIDNMMPNMHQAAARRLVLEEARCILNGNTNAIIFALDADEVLEGDFMQSEAWEKIIYSKPNDCFEWSWMNLTPDAKRYTVPTPCYWAVHVSEELWDGLFPDNNVHEWRLPLPEPYAHEIVLESFYSIHFASLNKVRYKNKHRFYQVNSMEDRRRYNVINLYRQYHPTKVEVNSYPLPEDAYIYYLQNGIDILGLLKIEDDGPHLTHEIKDYFKKNGTQKYAMLDIWDADWCAKNKIAIPKRTTWQKLVMLYLKKSNPYSRSFVIRGIDKILKIIYK